MDWSKLPVLRNDKLLFQDTSMAPLPGGIVPCLLCCKPFIMGFFVGTPDQLCPECENLYKDTAKVICVRCRPPVTICRLVPKILDNGFYIRPKSVLHSDCCNICKPGLTVSSILEIEEWERKRRPNKLILPVGKSASTKHRA
jgi:hypothetical protein